MGLKTAAVAAQFHAAIIGHQEQDIQLRLFPAEEAAEGAGRQRGGGGGGCELADKSATCYQGHG